MSERKKIQTGGESLLDGDDSIDGMLNMESDTAKTATTTGTVLTKKMPPKLAASLPSKKRKQPDQAADDAAEELKHRNNRAKRIDRTGVVSKQDREDIEREEAESGGEEEWIDDNENKGDDDGNNGHSSGADYDSSDPFLDEDEDADDEAVQSAFGPTLASAAEHAVDRLEQMYSMRAKQRLIHQREDQNRNERAVGDMRMLLSDFMAAAARIRRENECNACKEKRANLSAQREKEDDE